MNMALYQCFWHTPSSPVKICRLPNQTLFIWLFFCVSAFRLVVFCVVKFIDYLNPTKSPFPADNFRTSFTRMPANMRFIHWTAHLEESGSECFFFVFCVLFIRKENVTDSCHIIRITAITTIEMSNMNVIITGSRICETVVKSFWLIWRLVW